MGDRYVLERWISAHCDGCDVIKQSGLSLAVSEGFNVSEPTVARER